MKVIGNICKLRVENTDPVSYRLPIGDELLSLNKIIDCKITLTFDGEINCVHCDRPINKSYSQGYCFPCMRSLAECDICIVRPEKCHYFLGTCRQPAWGEEHCLQHHIVYLANTSTIKVGITRQANIPSRWIDQGATQALAIMRVSNRLISGQVEEILKEYIADKTNWREMLKSDPKPVNLQAKWEELSALCSESINEISAQEGPDAIEYLSSEEMPGELVELKYPISQYPGKIKSLNFDKQQKISGILQGIKGQYLILDSGVLNIRKFSGYKIELIVTG